MLYQKNDNRYRIHISDTIEIKGESVELSKDLEDFWNGIEKKIENGTSIEDSAEQLQEAILARYRLPDLSAKKPKPGST